MLSLYDRVETGPDFVPGLPHGVAHSLLFSLALLNDPPSLELGRVQGLVQQHGLPRVLLAVPRQACIP